MKDVALHGWIAMAAIGWPSSANGVRVRLVRGFLPDCTGQRFASQGPAMSLKRIGALLPSTLKSGWFRSMLWPSILTDARCMFFIAFGRTVEEQMDSQEPVTIGIIASLGSSRSSW